MDEKNLPIKKVNLTENNITSNTAGGSVKFFGEYNEETKKFIKNEFNQIYSYYQDFFEEHGDVPIASKVVMKKEAIAKSHKPKDLLRDLPIVGGNSIDEIIIRVSKVGLNSTIQKIDHSPSDKVKANMTAIEEIIPINPESIISLNLKETISNNGQSPINVKVKLFDFNDEYYNKQIFHYVVEEFKKAEFIESYKFHDLSKSLQLFDVNLKSANSINLLSKINGIKSIDIFQKFSAISGLEVNFSDKSIAEIYSEEEEISNYIIGIFDSGISPNNKYIDKYVIDRHSYIPEKYLNYGHGTFVASIIQYGNQLNGIDSDTNKRFKFVDVPILPNTDPQYGEIGDPIGEIDFMECVEDALLRYSETVKLWNMSLGTNTVMSENTVSDLGIFIDDMQELYGVQIILASGNYVGNNLLNRTWPPTDIQLGFLDDRITSPADSVNAISVGSIALNDSHDSVVKVNEPSPFSRKGPGPNFMVKPELVDYGGNLDTYRNLIGVIGLDDVGNEIENIGTSFSAPRITRKFALIHDEIEDKNLLLSKALLIHSARIESRDLTANNNYSNYYGFGTPSNYLIDFVYSSESEVTLVFNQSITQSTHLEMWDFPYPSSLTRNGKHFGEIAITLVYSPKLDKNYGSEYCRTNIDISFGTYDENGKFSGKVPIEKSWDERTESELVKNGYKWSPVKSYYKKFVGGTNQKSGWKLRVDLTPRLGLENVEQEFVLVVTIKDPDNNDIYSELINELELRGYSTNDLRTSNQIQQRN